MATRARRVGGLLLGSSLLPFVLLVGGTAGCGASGQGRGSSVASEDPDRVKEAPTPEPPGLREPSPPGLVDGGPLPDAQARTDGSPTREPDATAAEPGDAGRADALAEGPSDPEEATRAARTRTHTLHRGRAQFARHCSRCHPGGRRGLGPSLIGRRLSAGRVRRQIRKGRGSMRPIPAARLGNAQLRAVLLYLGTLDAVR